MARRKRDLLPQPPGGGGYEFEVVVPGPPAYFDAPPAVNARGGLVPAGDVEGLPARPAPQTDDATGLTADACLQLGLVRQAQKDFPAALALLERAVALAESHGDSRQLARALIHHGTLLRQLGRNQEAEATLSKALTVLGEAA